MKVHPCPYSVFLFLLIAGCDNASQPVNNTPQEQAELQQFITHVKSDLVFVKGSEFLMGN